MRILFLTPDWPDPPDQGAKLRSNALIRAAIAARHQVDVVSFTSRPADLDASQSSVAAGPPSPPARREEGVQAASAPISPLADLCHQVVLVPAPPPRSVLARSWGLLFDPMPDIAHRMDSSDFHEALRQLDLRSYHVVQIEGLEMISYLGTVRVGAERAALIYDAHNAEMYLQRTIMQTELRDPLRLLPGLYSFTQWSKLGSYERIMMNETDIVLAVSDVDVGKLRGRHVEPVLIPNGVDTSATAMRQKPGVAPRLLFIGPLGYRPNRDAVRWLTSAIFPRIRAQVPEAELRLVGRGMETISGDGIVGLGYLDDPRPEIDQAAALVVPMRMGGGTRFKVLEAMASGLPVVSTPMSMMGISAVHEQEALIATTPAGLAAECVRLLRDPALGQTLAVQARALMEKRYDWGKITPAYIKMLSGARRLRSH